jgi:hypothetical protein
MGSILLIFWHIVGISTTRNKQRLRTAEDFQLGVAEVNNDVHIPRNCQWHEEDGEDKEPHHRVSPGLEMEMEDVPDLRQKMTIQCGK